MAPLWAPEAPAFRWAIETVGDDEVVVVVLALRARLSLSADGRRLQVQGHMGHLVFERYLRDDCHWLERAYFGLEIRTEEDGRWFQENVPRRAASTSEE
jgi:hypothetical protein